MSYFQEDDVFHLPVSEEPEAASIEISPNITVELEEKGELIEIEVLDANGFLRDSLLDTVQSKMLVRPQGKVGIDP